MKLMNKRIISLLLALVLLIGLVPTNALAAEIAESDANPYKGKVISILGDSISTFAGYIPTADGTNLEHKTFYPKLGVTSVDATWWMQTIIELDAKLGVNESWSGSYVLNTMDGNSGNQGEDAAMASMTRIQNLDSNGSPDVILFFGGTNDIAFGSPLGIFDPAVAPTETDLTSVKWKTYADAYVDAIMRMQHCYPESLILAIFPTENKYYYDAQTREAYVSLMTSVCDHYGVSYVDPMEEGFALDSMMGDVTHPNASGMSFIASCVVEKLLNEHIHAFTASVTAPTCTEQGYTTYTCICGDSYVDSYVDAVGHSYGEWQEVTAPTKDSLGVQQRVCACGGIETQEVEGVWQMYALADHLLELPENVCCDTNLWALLPHEDVHFTSGKRWGTNSTPVTSITIPLNPGDRVYATSWNKAGENGHETLNGIRLTFFDAYGIAQTLGPGESYSKFAANGGYLVAPEGTIAINIAMWYDSEDYEVFILNREHIYEQVTVAPTCSEQGYSGTICLGCGDGETHSYTDALGHSLTAHEAKAPTCTDIGWEAYETCSRCEHSTYTEIPALSHSYGKWEQITAPTCDAEGQDMSVCTNCGETVVRDTRISGDPGKILVSNPVPEGYYEGKRILAIGDSLTAGTGVTTEQRYHALLAERLNATNINSGTSGATLCPGGHLPNKFETLMTANYLNKNSIDVVTIFLGINDWDNGVVNGTYQGKLKYDESLTYYDFGEFGTDDTTTIYGAAKMWCERILELKATAGCEDVQFVFATPVITSWNKSLTTAKDWNQDKVNVFGYTLREYCTAIMEVCAYYEIPVLDLNMYSGMYYHSENDNNVDYFGGDGIHPGVNGHAMMADAFIEFLLEGYSYENRTVANCGHSYVNRICENCHLPNPSPVITQQPVDGEAKLGERYMVEVKVEGEGLKYQWYFRNAGSSTWYKSSVKDNTYDDVMTTARAGREVYCVIIDAYGNTVTTDTVKLIPVIEELEIITQPTNGEAVLGENYCVTVEAKGEGLKYQWYFRNAGSTTFSKSSVKDNTYDDVMTKARAGREVYCVITDAFGNTVTTDVVKLIRVPAKLEITSQPTDATAGFDEMFCATVEAKGEGLKYQWYFRNAGSNTWCKSGVRDNTYDDVMTKARNGREIYCVITDAYGNTVTTDIVKLIAVPKVELKLLGQSYESAAMGETYCVTVEAQGEGLKYQWYFHNAGSNTWYKSGVTDNTYDDVMNKTRANREVYCVITDAFGNQTITEVVTLTVEK